MTSKNKSKKIPCPLCERPCYEGSTDAKLIKSKGVCLRCAFGKSIDQINALLLDKEKNKALKAGTSLPIENFDFSKTKDKGVTVVMTINKSKCVEEMSFEELNTAKIDNNCNCAACQHHKNNDEMKVKSPAIFEGYEVNVVFIRNENASFDGGFDEEVAIKRTWQKPDGSPWVTYLSNQRLGFLDMQLSNFAKRYKTKPVEAAAPLSESKIYFEGVKTNEVVGSARVSDDKRYFHVVFSTNKGGKCGYKKGRIYISTNKNKIFNINELSRNTKDMLKNARLNTKGFFIESWQEINKSDYQQLKGENNEND